MTFDETLAQVIGLLQREGRVSYRALKRRFVLDDEYLEDLKVEIIQAKKLAIDEDGTVLVWKGDSSTSQTPNSELWTLDLRRQTLDGMPENAGSSPLCSAIWWVLLPSPSNSIPKNCARWCGRIKRHVPR